MTEITRDFLYLRHGETDWNRQGRMQGSTDIPLNETGRAQAHAAAERLAGQRIDRIICSPMARAAETAEIVAAPHGLAPIADPRLTERYFGAFDGLLLSEIRAAQGLPPDASIWSLSHPEAEPHADALSRLTASIAEHLASREGEVLFVAHGALFTLLTEALTGARLTSANAAPYRIAKTAQTWAIDPL